MADQINTPINYPVIAGGKIVVGGKVLFGNENQRPDEDNPATLKAIYTESTLTIQAENPQPLGRNGEFDQSVNGTLYGPDDSVYSILILDRNGRELSYTPSFNLNDTAAATSAAASAAAAAASESNAAASEGVVVANYTDFVNRYFGAYASDPAIDPAGNPPSDGSLYFNTVSDVFFVWNGSDWITFGPMDISSYLVTATGTTTPRTLGGRFADVVDLKDEGAIGDGVSVDTVAINAAMNTNGETKSISDGLYLSDPNPISNKNVKATGTLKQNSQDQNMFSVFNSDKKVLSGLKVEVNKTLGASGQATVDRDSTFSTFEKYKVTEMGGRGFGILSYSTLTESPNIANTYHDLKFMADGTKKATGDDSGGLLLANNKFSTVSDVYAQNLGQFGAYELKNVSEFNVAANIVSNTTENAVYFGTDDNTFTPNNIVNNLVSYNSDYSAINLGQSQGNIVSNIIAYDDVDSVATQPHGVTIDGGKNNTVSNLKLKGYDATGRNPYPIRFRGDASENFISVTSDMDSSNLIIHQDTAHKNCVRVDMAQFSNLLDASATLGDRSVFNGTSESSTVYAPFTGQHIGTTTGHFLWMPSYVTLPSMFSTDRFRMIDGSATGARAVIGSASQTGTKYISNIGEVNVSYSSIVANAEKGLRIDLGYNNNNSANPYVEFAGTEIVPSVDNSVTLGNASKRYSEIFAGNGTINTSDERLKTKLLEIEDRERTCALEVKASIRKFKMTDAVEVKGDNARIHFGVGAQTVVGIFEKHGLNAMEYGMICYDSWEEQQERKDEGGNVVDGYQEAGDRYGIRYDELSMFILAAI